jgi:hypothetical protein
VPDVVADKTQPAARGCWPSWAIACFAAYQYGRAVGVSEVRTADAQFTGRAGARWAARLMALSAGWAALVAMQLLTLGRITLLIDGQTVDRQLDVPWSLVAIALIAGAGSLVAAVQLRRGAIGPARTAMAVAVLAGLMGLLGAVAGVVSLWLTRRSD